jgi:hypothetical protein
MGAQKRGKAGHLPPPMEFKYNVEHFNLYFDLNDNFNDILS